MPPGPITRDDKLTLLFYLMTRQTGAIADCLRHIQSTKQNTECSDEELKGWVGFIGSELADMTVIVRKMGNLLGLGHDTIGLLGIKRDAEKKAEYLKRHPGATWI